jgi:hypothetical protein
MSDFAQHPLWDAERDEPYLPLPGFPDLRLTPYRVGDDEAAVSLSSAAYLMTGRMPSLAMNV